MNRYSWKMGVIIFCSFLSVQSIAFQPYNELEIAYVDLNHYPEKINHFGPDTEITIGDLHGNALKLLNFLIHQEVISMPAKDYQNFVEIYHTPPDNLTSKDIAIFHAIINAMSINPAHPVRFLGDDLCDRGMNDYFTLHLFKKLDLANVNFEVVLSNHNNFFLSAYERPEKSFSYNPYGEGNHESLVRSMLNLGKLIDRGLVDKQDILEIIQTNYLKHLVFPGMTVNKNKQEITLYTHAPVDLQILSNLAKDLNIDYQDSDLNHLVQTYSSINRQIQSWIMQNQFSTNYKRLNERHKTENTPSPIQQVLWNRNYTILERVHKPEGKAFSINYVHGHDSQSNVVDLDNKFGKGDNYDRGPLAVYMTNPGLSP
jgi:hypothetical protein